MFSVKYFRIDPAGFWELSFREFQGFAEAALSVHGEAALDRPALVEMMARFPDKPFNSTHKEG